MMVMVKLMRCAVIECSVPVWSISVSSGVLILGEDNGVRVFNLRQLLKCKVKKVKKVKGFVWNGKLDGKGLKSPNGLGMIMITFQVPGMLAMVRWMGRPIKIVFLNSLSSKLGMFD
ncbi:hypothetical protein OIU85_028000 [Salix viminalis]|uniref:Uncharacterized protein n=1 Tax=Salix viminalis TaxID=40686 RepID=A0A9Q0TAS8_SALVM|nr:hypothetical protein OIU85_028000 [Salix viminalis]